MTCLPTAGPTVHAPPPLLAKKRVSPSRLVRQRLITLLTVPSAVAEVLRPFELTLRYCRAAWQPLFHWHGIDSNAAYDDTARAAVAQSAQDYLAHLARYYP